MKFSIFIALPLILLINIKLSSCEIFEECNGIADETFVASKSDCRTYIYCTGEDSLSGECDEGQYFDPEASACDDAENVYCALDEIAIAEENPVTEAELTTVSTTTTNNIIITTTITQAAASADTAKPTDLPTTLETTVAATTTTYKQTTTVNHQDLNNLQIIDNAPIVGDNCPSNDNQNQLVLIANNQSCSDYYICYHGNAIEMHCSSHLHFNKATGMCDYPENVQCMQSVTIGHKCLPHVTGFFPHPDNCNYFYYCIRGFLTVQQCPFFYGWDIEKIACVQISTAKCYNNNNGNNNVNKNNNNNNNNKNMKKNKYY